MAPRAYVSPSQLCPWHRRRYVAASAYSVLLDGVKTGPLRDIFLEIWNAEHPYVRRLARNTANFQSPTDHL